MKFFDLSKRKNATKLNLVAVVFALIAISGVFLSIQDINKTKKPSRKEQLEKIANDTTLKNINVKYKDTEDKAAPGKSRFKSSRDYTAKFFQSMLTITILLILVFGVLYFYKKKKQPHLSSNIKVVDRKYLGQKQYIATVVVENEKLLLGVTDHSINLIKKLDLPTKRDSQESEPQEEFPKILGKIRKSENEKK